MKRLILLIVLLVMPCALLAGCGSGAENSGAAVSFDVEIREKMFVTQMNEIYVNVDDYLGKSIKLEGMFMSTYYEPTDSIYCMVMRNGPGCCGTDGVVGFEVIFDENTTKTPKDNDWVEAIGTLEWYEELSQWYLRLNLSSLRVLNTRGAETVLQ